MVHVKKQYNVYHKRGTTYNDVRKAYEDTYGKSKYINIYQQIDSLAFDDIDIEIDRYPIVNVNSFHIIIKSKEGYGLHKYVTSSNIFTCFPIPDNELDKYIVNARCFFNKTKQLIQNYVRKSQ